MRFELDGPNLAVMPDSPFLKHYKVDYVNMARNVTGTVSGTPRSSTSRPGARVAAARGNHQHQRQRQRRTPGSRTSRKNQFWESLEKISRTSCAKPTRCCPEKGQSKTSHEQANEHPKRDRRRGPAANCPWGRPRHRQRPAGQPNPQQSTSQATGNSLVRRTDDFPRSRLGHRECRNRHHHGPRHPRSTTASRNSSTASTLGRAARLIEATIVEVAPRRLPARHRTGTRHPAVAKVIQQRDADRPRMRSAI